MKVQITNRWSGKVQCEVEIDAQFESSPLSVQLGAAVKVAHASRAYLAGADLAGAYLADADLGDKLIQGPIRSDGYQFMLSRLHGDGTRIIAGCRSF